MPTISLFYGIVIKMFYSDHVPPHFHAQYGEYKAVIDIQRMILIGGNLPRRALNLVLDWTELHMDELLANWQRAQDKAELSSIKPLE